MARGLGCKVYCLGVKVRFQGLGFFGTFIPESLFALFDKEIIYLAEE